MKFQDVYWYSSQIGCREFYGIPRIMNSYGKLEEFYTDFWIKPKYSRLLSSFSKGISNRYNHELSHVNVRAQPVRAMMRRFSDSDNIYNHWLREGTNFSSWCAKKFITDSHLHSQSATFGYTSANLELIRAANRSGALSVHGQIDPGIEWYNIQKEERILWPGAEDNKLLCVTDEYLDRIRQEWDESETIIVNSEYAKSCLKKSNVESKKIHVVPLSFQSSLSKAPNPSDINKSSFNVLFIGNLSLAKGYQYFAESQKFLSGDYSFFAAGNSVISREFMHFNNWKVNLLGHLNRRELLLAIDKAHVIVFPTLSDGFGQVQLEALSRGKPVISTENCAAIVEDGKTGFVVPVRDARAIANSIERISKSKEVYDRMCAESFEASNKFTLANTARHFISAIESTMVDR